MGDYIKVTVLERCCVSLGVVRWNALLYGRGRSPPKLLLGGTRAQLGFHGRGAPSWGLGYFPGTV